MLTLFFSDGFGASLMSCLLELRSDDNYYNIDGDDNDDDKQI